MERMARENLEMKDGLNKKEQRLWDYLVEQEAAGHKPTIGEIRKACRTTVRTLLGKTLPEMERKIEAQHDRNHFIGT